MIGNIAQFWRLTRELDVNQLRADFERDVSVRILGSDRDTAERAAHLLNAAGEGPALRVGELAGWDARIIERDPPDAIIAAIGGQLDAASRRTLSDLSIGETPLLLVQMEGGADLVVLGIAEERVVRLDTRTEAEARDRIVNALLDAVPEVMLPLGRRSPQLRDAVAEHLVRDASRVNAQFAALSSLPASIPLVGGIVGDVADILVLTKNQVILLFKLAGLYGRDLRFGRQLLMEVVPVLGGAFLWRSTARALVGLLPGFVATLPKMVVAYAGTYVVGEMARYYFDQGRKPPADMVVQFQAEALRLARGSLDVFKRG